MEVWIRASVSFVLSNVVLSHSSVQSWLPKSGVVCCELLGDATTWDQASWVWKTNVNELQCGSRPVSVTGCSQWNGGYFSVSVNPLLLVYSVEMSNRKLRMRVGHCNLFLMYLFGLSTFSCPKRRNFLTLWLVVGCDNIVSIVTDYRLESPGIKSQGGVWDYYIHPPSHLYYGHRVSILVLRRPRRGVDHPPLTSAKVKKE